MSGVERAGIEGDTGEDGGETQRCRTKHWERRDELHRTGQALDLDWRLAPHAREFRAG